MTLRLCLSRDLKKFMTPNSPQASIPRVFLAAEIEPAQVVPCLEREARTSGLGSIAFSTTHHSPPAHLGGPLL